MYIACSTLCFGRLPLSEALQSIAELEFSKYEVAIHETRGQLRPSDVAADVNTIAQRLRMGPGLTPAAFCVSFQAPDEEEASRQFRAVCRLARLTAVPIVTIQAGPADSGLDPEIERLKRLTALAESDGVQLTVATEIGTLTEDPDRAVHLCQRVPGLGLTFDPSHYVAGPYSNKSYDSVYPFVRHVRLRDTGKGPNQFQVRVGQGAIEYGRIISHLNRFQYDRALTVDIRDVPETQTPMVPEVRKLKYLLESLV